MGSIDRDRAPAVGGGTAPDRTGPLVVAVVAALMVVAGCGGDEGDEPDGGDQVPAGAGQQLRTVDMAFEPNELRIGVGEELTIVNDDQLAHTVTASGGAFDVAVEADQLVRLTVDASGSYPFRCELHPSMTGRLVVTS